MRVPFCAIAAEAEKNEFDKLTDRFLKEVKNRIMSVELLHQKIKEHFLPTVTDPEEAEKQVATIFKQLKKEKLVQLFHSEQALYRIGSTDLAKLEYFHNLNEDDCKDLYKKAFPEDEGELVDVDAMFTRLADLPLEKIKELRGEVQASTRLAALRKQAKLIVTPVKYVYCTDLLDELKEAGTDISLTELAVKAACEEFVQLALHTEGDAFHSIDVLLKRIDKNDPDLCVKITEIFHKNAIDTQFFFVWM
jgi:aryl carrier-like protein